MTSIFNQFKRYIITHPKKANYKPTSNRYNKNDLCDISNKLDIDNLKSESEIESEFKLIEHFVDVSSYLNSLYKEAYKEINIILSNLNSKGGDLIGYFIAALNREYYVITDKLYKQVKLANIQTIDSADLISPKLKSISEEVGYISVAGALELQTDIISFLLNFLRHQLDKEFNNKEANPKEFAAQLIHIQHIAAMAVSYKSAYDNMLYTGGFVTIDNSKKTVLFNYDNHQRLKLLHAGHMMFIQRKIQIQSEEATKKQSTKSIQTSFYRIKKCEVINGVIKLSFGKGIAKDLNSKIEDTLMAMKSFYEFIDLDTNLPNFNNSTLNEGITIWSTIQYIASYVLKNNNLDRSIYEKKDFNIIPYKIKDTDLIDYIIKLTSFKRKNILSILKCFEADLKKHNDIWFSPLYLINNYYNLPLFPIIEYVSYNIIDHLLENGGCDLKLRGVFFEDFLYSKLSNTKNHNYYSKCFPGKKYGLAEDFEEIDIIIELKNTIIIAEAKCIRYSIEPANYSDALERLEDGCIQANRKSKFMRDNPQYFDFLKDYHNKQILPIVVTNFPTFTGFNHDGVYIIDSHSLITYINGGVFTKRVSNNTSSRIVSTMELYNTEDEFSSNIINYLKNNPIKKEFFKKIVIADQPVIINVEPWNIIVKTAQYDNDPRFNIKNSPTPQGT